MLFFLNKLRIKINFYKRFYLLKVNIICLNYFLFFLISAFKLFINFINNIYI